MKNKPLLLTLAMSLAGTLSSLQAATYSIDTGTAVNAIGDNTSPAWSAAAINHFTVTAGSQNIVSISAVFGSAPPTTSQIVGGEPFTAVLWSDPNGDGNPNDAAVLSSASGVITVFNDNVTFQTTAITPVGLSVGQSFFAGIYFQGYNNKFPMGVTGPGSLSDSWVSFNAAAPLNLNNLSAANAFGTIQAVVGQPVVAMVRANGVPEPTAAVLAGLASLGFLRRRRNS